MICELSEKAAKAPETAARPAPASSGQPSAAASPASAANVDLLLDIEVDASLRFGSRELAIRELLETGPGDVLELDRHITDPVDLVVGDKIVARGEVVLVNGNFGLRVTEVAEPKKCLESVRCLF
ncbi:MAG TPA: flagellar motor switch protein FliN [Acidobacterium sp.]|nr:flagellar motor switch protein FliN [Acidobacterium sp.]